MSTWRRSVFNLRRRFLAAALAVVVIALVGGIVIVAVRSADDPGLYALRAVEIAGALFLLAVVCGIVGRPLPRRIVLEVDLAELPPEASGTNPLAELTGAKTLTLRQVVETIDRAATDDRVKVMLAYVTFDGGGLGAIQELRDAVLRFRAAGKTAIAFADTFGQLGGGNASYYLASAFDEIAVQSGGQVGFIGLHRDVNFVKRALDKLGVAVHVEGRYEYKNAANQLIETGFTGPHREALARVMDSQWEQIVAGVADARGMTLDAVQAAADGGPLSAAEALAAGLVDRVAFRDEMVDRAKELAGPKSELRWLPRYRRFAVRGGRGRPTVAVVTAVGAIDRTKMPINPLSPSSTIAADKTAAAIRKAVADKKVKAVLLRVNSPGGSAVGSETIWREVVRAEAAGKPVVASMGDVAASGGYYISMAARRIVAHPGTVTGSIGVVAQKPVLAEAKKKIGFDVEELTTAANAGLVSVNRDFLPSEQERFSGWLDHVYEDFIAKVGAGRNMSRDEVHEVARGRIWTGADAKDRRLVDDLGGFAVAFDAIRAAAGLAPGADLRLVDFPKTSLLSRVRSSSGRNSEDPKAMVSALLETVRTVARAAGLAPDRGVLHAAVDADDVRIR